VISILNYQLIKQETQPYYDNDSQLSPTPFPLTIAMFGFFAP